MIYALVGVGTVAISTSLYFMITEARQRRVDRNYDRHARTNSTRRVP